MFRFLRKKAGYLLTKNKIQNQLQESEKRKKQELNHVMIKPKLDDNLTYIKNKLGNSGDLVVHDIQYGVNRSRRCALLFIDGLVNNAYITESIIKPITLHSQNTLTNVLLKPEDELRSLLCAGEMMESDSMESLLGALLAGDSVLLADDCEIAFLVSTKGWEKRSISEPTSESVIRGPREGFTEDFRTNTSLIRRKLKNPHLRMDHMTIGERTATNVCVFYIEGIAKPELVNEVKRRLKGITVDAILDAGYIEEYIEDHPLSLFPTISYTQKPDVAAGKVLEGRVGIIVEGSPFVLTAPMLFIEAFQSAEDYYTRFLFISFTRILRFITFIITLFGPAFYVAMTTHQQELIPTTLLFTIAQAREGTPFPAIIEALIMVFAFELLREAGLRLPRPIGQAISIVGALIMGDAAVSAGIVGAPMVITIAVTAVAGFVVPEQVEAATVIRVISLFAAAALGGYGIAICFIGVLIHLASIKSFGVNYFDGFLFTRDVEDTYIRIPLWLMKKRPKSIAGQDKVRIRASRPPNPAPTKEGDS